MNSLVPHPLPCLVKTLGCSQSKSVRCFLIGPWLYSFGYKESVIEWFCDSAWPRFLIHTREQSLTCLGCATHFQYYGCIQCYQCNIMITINIMARHRPYLAQFRFGLAYFQLGRKIASGYWKHKARPKKRRSGVTSIVWSPAGDINGQNMHLMAHI